MSLLDEPFQGLKVSRAGLKLSRKEHRQPATYKYQTLACLREPGVYRY